MGLGQSQTGVHIWSPPPFWSGAQNWL